MQKQNEYYSTKISLYYPTQSHRNLFYSQIVLYEHCLPLISYLYHILDEVFSHQHCYPHVPWQPYLTTTADFEHKTEEESQNRLLKLPGNLKHLN
jgi:hypothetical protein